MTLRKALQQLERSINKIAQEPDIEAPPPDLGGDIEGGDLGDLGEGGLGDLGGELGGGDLGLGGGLGAPGMPGEPGAAPLQKEEGGKEKGISTVDDFIADFTNDVFSQMKSWFKELFKNSFAKQFGELIGQSANLPLNTGNDAVVSSQKDIHRFLNLAARTNLNNAVDAASINTLCDVTDLMLKYAADEKPKFQFKIPKKKVQLTKKPKQLKKKQKSLEEIADEAARKKINNSYAITSRLSPSGPDDAIFRKLNQAGGMSLKDYTNLLQEKGYSLGEFTKMRPQLQTKHLRRVGPAGEFSPIESQEFNLAISDILEDMNQELIMKAMELGKEADVENDLILDNYSDKNRILVKLLDAYITEIKNKYVTNEWNKIRKIWAKGTTDEQKVRRAITALIKDRPPELQKLIEAKPPIAKLYDAYKQVSLGYEIPRVFNNLLSVWHNWLGGLTKNSLRELVEHTAQKKTFKSFDKIKEMTAYAITQWNSPANEDRRKTEKGWGLSKLVLGTIQKALPKLKVYYQEMEKEEALEKIKAIVGQEFNFEKFLREAKAKFERISHNPYLDMFHYINYLLLFWNQVIDLNENSERVITSPSEYKEQIRPEEEDLEDLEDLEDEDDDEGLSDEDFEKLFEI